jgi:hypothetical protein
MAETPLSPPLHQLPIPDAVHEEKPFPVGMVLKLAGWFVVAIVIVHGIIFFYLLVLSNGFPNTQQGPSSVVNKINAVPLPRRGDDIAQPRLQESDRRDLEKLHMEEAAKLTGYRWVNEKDGIVQLPIDRAMELLVDRDTTARAKTTKGKGARP